MLLTPIEKRIAENAVELTFDDLMPNKEQRASILHQAAITVAHILTEHVDGAKKYANSPILQFTRRRPQPQGYRTRIIPLVSTIGPKSTAARHVAIVKDLYVKKLHMTEESFQDRAIPSFNSAATNSSIRRARMTAAPSGSGTPTHIARLLPLQLGPGLHDILRKLMTSVLKIHCPDPNSNSSTLARSFKLIGKAHLAHGKPQDHFALLSAFETVLSASFLDCWRINCGHRSVEAYIATSPTPEEILSLAKKIVIKHANRVVPKAPAFEDDAEYSSGMSDKESEDVVFSNQRLLLRDLLYVFMLKNAISDGDFGRIEDFLGVIAVHMTGAGLQQTADEIMHFIYNLKNVWPEPFAYVFFTVYCYQYLPY